MLFQNIRENGNVNLQHNYLEINRSKRYYPELQSFAGLFANRHLLLLLIIRAYCSVPPASFGPVQCLVRRLEYRFDCVPVRLFKVGTSYADGNMKRAVCYRLF